MNSSSAKASLQIVNPALTENAESALDSNSTNNSTLPPSPPESSSALLSIRVHETHSVQYEENYKILHLIQKGGWGAVFAAERADGRPVAMKFFGYSKYAPIHSYINNEILIMMALRGCSGAIQIESIFYDRPQGFISSGPNRKIHGLTESYPVIVMERTTGMDLLDLISYNKDESKKPDSEGGQFTYRSIAIIFRNLILALQSVHDRGFIHRDLKLDNVLSLGKSIHSGVKIIDFGSMISVSKDNEVNVHLRNSLVGTREMLAPESTSKRSYTFKSDIWQAGCCLYNMIFMTSLPNDFIRTNVSNPNSFYNKTQEEFEAILFPHFPQWNLVPASARDLIKGMLKLNVDERLSIKQILEHPFLSVSHDSSSTEMESNELEKSYESKLNRVLFGQKLRKHYRVSQGQSSSDVNPDNLQEMVQHFFALFDTDGDQVISLQELHDGVAKIYLDDEGVTKKAIDELFSSIDTDGDGYIDKGEFDEFFYSAVSFTSCSTFMDTTEAATGGGGL